MIVPLPSADVIAVRRYRPDDAEATLQVFRQAVRRGAAGHYSETQRFAWANSVIGLTIWQRARAAVATWVAEICGEVAGFTDLTDAGEVGMLYVHPNRMRRGVGKALLDEVEREARLRGHLNLRTQASLVAEPLFTREGYVVVSRQLVALGDERLPNALMQKVLEPLA